MRPVLVTSIVIVATLIIIVLALLVAVFGSKQCAPEIADNSSCAVDDLFSCSVQRISTTEKATVVRLILWNGAPEPYDIYDVFLSGDDHFGPKCDILGRTHIAEGENVTISCVSGGTIEQGASLSDGFEFSYTKDAASLGKRARGTFSGIVKNPETKWFGSC